MTTPIEPPPSPAAVIQGWNRFWFAPADPTVLGLVRICAGLVVLYIHLAYSFDLQAVFGSDAWVNLASFNEVRRDAPIVVRGNQWQEIPVAPQHKDKPYSDADRKYILTWSMHPDQTYAHGYYAWSIWYHVTDPTWMRVVHGLVLLNLVLFVLGLGTRVTSVVAWLSNLSYIQRNYTGLFGVDTITNLAMLYLMIGPSGAALSIDRLIQRYWHTRRALRIRASNRKSEPDSEFFKAGDALEFQPPRPSVSANFALRLLQVHVCFVYLASGLSKLQGAAWWNGTAIWWTLVNPELSPVNHPWYVECIRFLCDHRWLWELFVTGGVLFTLVFEISFCYLVWNRRLRWTMIAAAVMLHTGIAFFMGLTTFSLMMLAVVLSFTPPEAVHWLVDKLTRGPDRFQFLFALRDRGQVRAASLVHAVDIGDQVRLMPTGLSGDEVQTPGLYLIEADGTILTGYSLFERLVRSLRLLWPVALWTWLPGMAFLARRWFPDEEPSSSVTVKEADQRREKVPQ